ncbi:MAG: hypothetical protein GX087_00960 [Desulfobulbaceae bacterium]|nr:hypothetical protein [Desulfobulbaceae bacterium]
MLSRSKSTKSIFFKTALAAFALVLLVIQASLRSDFAKGDWSGLLTRLALAALVALAIAWKSRNILQDHVFSWKQLILAFFFMVAVCGPLVAQVSFLGKSVSDVSRYLAGQREGASAKALHVFRHFPDTYQTYLNQHFKLPPWYVQLNALIKVHIFGYSPNNNITKGLDGFYFEGMGSSRVEKDIVETFDNIADYMGQIPFSDEELRQWKITLEERSYWLKARGSEFVFVLAPTKAFVYPEYLPRQIQEVRGRSRYQQLAEYLQQYADIHFIDLLPPLLEAKEERAYPLLFYKTDFHWNFYGAFVAYQTMLERMQGFFPQYRFDVPGLEDFDLKVNEHWAHERFMFMLGLPLTGHRNEHHLTFLPKPGGLYDEAADLPPDGIYDVYPPMRKLRAADGATLDARLILNPAAPVSSIVLLGDSFLEKCVYFFSANAKRVLNFRTVVNFPDGIFHFEKPAIVIQEILNMFILRPPPENPEHMKQSYAASKFTAPSSHPLWSLQANAGVFQEKEQQRLGAGNAVPLHHLAQPVRGEVRSGLFKLYSPAEQSVRIQFVNGKGESIAEQAHSLHQGENEVYCILPATAVERMQLAGDDPQRAVTWQSVALRTDTK